MKDKDGSYDDGIYVPSQYKDSSNRQSNLGSRKRYKFYDDEGELDPGKMEWAPAYVANPMKNKYFIDGVEVPEWEVVQKTNLRLSSKNTVNQTNHPTFQEFHYETYSEKEWEEKKKKYEEFQKATSDPQYWWRYTQQSPYDQQKSDNDYLNHQKSTWGEEIERKARAKAEEELMTAKAKLQKQNLELMLISEKFAKLENENVELRKKVELFENDLEEYLRRKNADPYGEENWDK